MEALKPTRRADKPPLACELSSINPKALAAHEFSLQEPLAS